jgi:hypothetical protein
MRVPTSWVSVISHLRIKKEFTENQEALTVDWSYLKQVADKCFVLSSEVSSKYTLPNRDQLYIPM